jgi:hypothetical protein
MQVNLFTELPSLVVNGLHSARGVGEGWVAFDYETPQCSGTGLAAGAESGAGDLVLDLKLQGEQRLYFALGAKCSLRVWLTGDKLYREFRTEHGGNRLQECSYHVGEMDGKKLHIAIERGTECRPTLLAYIRAEAQAPHRSARNLIGTNDGFSWIALRGIDSPRDVGRYFAPLRNSDFFRILFGPMGADVSGCHATQVGTVAPLQATHAFRSCDRNYALERAKYQEAGHEEILAAAVSSARAAGVEIHFYVRPEAFMAPFPLDGAFLSQFFVDHPQWRCKDEFGEEIGRLSYAYPAVQQHMLEYFEELLQYDPDGLCLAFNRSLPLMICEEPVLQECERLSGSRPRLPAEVDSPAMVAARASLMTQFLRRVHALLQKQGKVLSVIVPANEELMRTSGLDLPALVEEGLLESICIHSGGFHALQSSLSETPFWSRLQTIGKTRIYPNGWGGSYDHAEAAAFLAETVFEPGYTGGFFWDTENLCDNPYNWEAVRRGGTKEYLEGAQAGTVPLPKFVEITSIQGMKLGRYSPHASY